MASEWFSTRELVDMALPEMPGGRKAMDNMARARNWTAPAQAGHTWRPRQGRGGGVEYHLSLLPAAAQARILLAQRTAAVPTTPAEQSKGEARWDWFTRLPAHKQEEAKQRLEALDTVQRLVENGVGRVFAMEEIARRTKVRVSTLYNWSKLVQGVPRIEWLAHLAPHQAGRAGERADCSPEAWEMLKADYLRPERPTFLACYRRLQATAAERGWTIPTARTLERRLDTLPDTIRVLARDGTDALKRMMPAQQRDRSALHALAAVNADGHKWDVFVRWPDGTIDRPMMLAFQDIYSGKVLSWRIDKTENKESFRLCFGDLVEEWGVPDACVLDNSRTFASKWMTGGAPNRFRFKVRDDEPLGVMTLMGVTIHWATPYHGQAKPIERAFRDLAGDLAKHPAFAGAYTGNKVDAKPENYASTAVPLEVFLATIGRGIIEHNARQGRTGGLCRGRSFDDVFTDSYASVPVRRASEHQRRLWLLAAERVLVNRTDGSITLEGNRFWNERLQALRGERVTVRFDPEMLQAPLHVYRADGDYLGAVPCIEAVGFLDADAARRHAATRKAWMRGVRMQLAAERTLSISEVARMLPEGDAPVAAPATKVVRPVFGNTALKQRPEDDPDNHPSRHQQDDERAFMAAVHQLRLVPNELDGDDPGEG